MQQRLTRKFRSTTIAAVSNLSPHLKRIVLTGDDLHDFPLNQDGVHVKAVISPDGIPFTEDGWRSATKRSYTIREFDSVNKLLILDFVINRHQGPATDWAEKAKVGDYLGIAGPGEPKLTDFNASSYLLIGDITSINAVNGYAKFISPEAQLTAVISVPTRADCIELDAGSHLIVHWHIEDETSTSLSDFIENLATNIATDSQVFIGLEASEVRAVKGLLLDNLGFNRINLHATGYWKKGLNADHFGADKKRNPL
jgi:NADPH-dependent ferric siderophore reductase